jgi:hypothetical protein
VGVWGKSESNNYIAIHFFENLPWIYSGKLSLRQTLLLIFNRINLLNRSSCGTANINFTVITIKTLLYDRKSNRWRKKQKFFEEFFTGNFPRLCF